MCCGVARRAVVRGTLVGASIMNAKYRHVGAHVCNVEDAVEERGVKWGKMREAGACKARKCEGRLHAALPGC